MKQLHRLLFLTVISQLRQSKCSELRLMEEKGFSFLACAHAVTFLFVYGITNEK